MTTWLLVEEFEVQVPTAQGDDDWEQDAWENDDAPDWADDDDDDWDDDDEDDDEEVEEDDSEDEDS
jgi:hypothetical protein